MSRHYLAGDLVKAAPPPHMRSNVVIGRPLGSNFWSVRVPHDTLLLVVVAPGAQDVSVTVLYEEQLVDVLLADVEYMSESYQ